jgi:hypothetical protein
MFYFRTGLFGTLRQALPVCQDDGQADIEVATILRHLSRVAATALPDQDGKAGSQSDRKAGKGLKKSGQKKPLQVPACHADGLVRRGCHGGKQL